MPWSRTESSQVSGEVKKTWGILLKVIISRDLDGVHVDQARFNGKWYHISIRGFNSLGTTNNLGSVINFAVEPFHFPAAWIDLPLPR